MKVQAQSSLEQLLEWNQALDKSRLVIILTNLGVAEMLCSFRLVLEAKTGKEILESSRLDFLEKFLVNNFALSDAEDNSLGCWIGEV